MGANFDHGKTSRRHPAHLFPERGNSEGLKEGTSVSFETEERALVAATSR